MNNFGIEAPQAEIIKAANEARRTLVEHPYVMMDVNTFQRKVLNGEISDDTGTAELFINGSRSTYHIYIDRHLITKSDGTLITYAGLMKMYDTDQLEIKYTKKKKRVMNMKQYREMLKEQAKNQPAWSQS